ncbi:hypothetical protein [Pseudoglutamicibacter cumminsii]|uniref:hypothetical protein n=1 Tax=Pseudoglutamicibacter cumminsii TaxID=156979 RepID=UPI0026EFB6B8|nr:hypothetical protein [Pseudoglutamicibacter cumminsii]
MSDMPLFSHAANDAVPQSHKDQGTQVRVEAVLPVDILNACEGLIDYTDLWWPREHRLSSDPEAQLIWDENSLFEVSAQGLTAVWGHNHGSEPPLELGLLIENENFPRHVATFKFTQLSAQSTRIDIRAQAPHNGSRVGANIWRDVLHSYSTFMGRRQDT